MRVQNETHIDTNLNFSTLLSTLSQFVKEFLNATLAERLDKPPSVDVLDLVWSITVSIYTLGGMFGAFSFGWLADRLGR